MACIPQCFLAQHCWACQVCMWVWHKSNLLAAVLCRLLCWYTLQSTRDVHP